MMGIKDWQNEVDKWISTYGVRYFSELTNMAILTEEVGEFARLIARKYGEQSFKLPKTEKEINNMISDEMADILWVLMCLANQMGINLEDALRLNMEKKTNRDSSRHLDNSKL